MSSRFVNEKDWSLRLGDETEPVARIKGSFSEESVLKGKDHLSHYRDRKYFSFILISKSKLAGLTNQTGGYNWKQSIKKN